MASEKSKEEQLREVFHADDVLPDCSNLFEDEPKGLEAAISDANVALDTNVLLLPYGAGASSLTQIVKIFEGLKKNHRLFIPAQVVREFVRNRPTKLAELYHQISDQVSKINVPNTFSYPILESVPEFDELKEKIVELAELKKQTKLLSESVRGSIKKWGWNDPVSQAYRPIFTSDSVVEIEINREQTLDEMTQRYALKIPPGYKDASKPDKGIGDFLIWKTLLKIGRDNQKDTVFVSGDAKADWFHGSGGSGFIPRYELQAEYKRESCGCDLYIIPLSKLLELLHAQSGSVDEVKTEELRIRQATIVSTSCPECGERGEYELAESLGSSAFPKCHSCDESFHLHRTNSGVKSHRSNHMPIRPAADEKEVEVVRCPRCDSENLKEVGLPVHSTAWCICDNCEKKFPVHRGKDGTVWVNSNFGG